MGTKLLPAVVSKAGNVRVPVIGWAVASLDPILVPGTSKERRALPPVLDQMFDRLGLPRREAGAPAPGAGPPRLPPDDPGRPPLLVFPEGCIVNQTTVIEFQRGAFVPRVPVQPVAISYPFLSHDASWTPDVAMPYMLYRLCTQVYNEMRVTWLPPVVPAPHPSDDVAAPAAPATGTPAPGSASVAGSAGAGAKAPLSSPGLGGDDDDAAASAAAAAAGLAPASALPPPPGPEGPWEHGVRTQHAIARQLGVRPCALSNADSYLYQGAMSGGFADYAMRHILAQPEAHACDASGGFYTRVARRHTRARMRDLIHLARRFAEADTDRDGALGREEFVSHFADTLITAGDTAIAERHSRRIGSMRATRVARASSATPLGDGAADADDTAPASPTATPDGLAEPGPAEPGPAEPAGPGAGIRGRLAGARASARRRRLALSLFAQLDRDGDGLLRWQELVLGLGLAESRRTPGPDSTAPGPGQPGGADVVGIGKPDTPAEPTRGPDAAGDEDEDGDDDVGAAMAAALGPASAAEAEAEAELTTSLAFQAELAFAVMDREGDGVLDRADVAWAVAALRRAREEDARRGVRGAADAVGAEGAGPAPGGDAGAPMLARASSAAVIEGEASRLMHVAARLGGGTATPPAGGQAMDLATFKRLVAADEGASELLAAAVGVVRRGVGGISPDE